MPRGGKRPGAGRPRKTELPAVLDGLDPRRQRYVIERLKGKTKKAAALAAGMSRHQANRPGELVENGDVRRVFQELMRLHAPVERLAKTLAAGLEAVEYRTATTEGRFSDTVEFPDYDQRRKTVLDIAELAGYDSKRPLMEAPQTECLVYRALGPNPSAQVVKVKQTQTVTEVEGMIVATEEKDARKRAESPIIITVMDDDDIEQY